MVVLDRDQLDEAGQLAGAAGLLLGGERRRREAVERSRHPAARGREAGRVASRGGARERGEGGVGGSAGAAPARPLVLGREDRPEAGGHRRGLGPARVEAALGGVARRRRAGRRRWPGRRRAGPSSRPARPGGARCAASSRTASVASTPGRVKRVALRNSRSSSQVAAARRVAGPHGRQGDGVAAAQKSAARSRPRAAARAVSSRARAARAALASAARVGPVGRRRVAPQALGERAAQLARGPPHQPLRGARLVEQQRALRLERQVLHALGRAPGRAPPARPRPARRARPVPAGSPRALALALSPPGSRCSAWPRPG